jgi:hypothetical protein
MFSNCANPKCAASFDDYRQGRLFRFRQSHPKGKAPANMHSVRHFWLCNRCSETYTLEYRRDQLMLMIRGHNGFSSANRNSFCDDSLESNPIPVLCELPLVKDSTD